MSSAGYDFSVVPPEVDESIIEGESPVDYVVRISESKARAVERGNGDVVLAADTTVVLEGDVIGKPLDAAHAVDILMRLAGRTHSVLTGWHIVSDQGERFGVDESRVRFRPRNEEELVDYVERTQPLDKAGAYGIQGDNGWLIESVAGSRANVMGLPVKTIVRELAELGVERSAP